MQRALCNCVRKRLHWLCLALSLSVVCAAADEPYRPGINVIAFHYGPSRLGWNPSEPRLTPVSVRSSGFGKLWQAPLDGGVPGSPLYLSGVTIEDLKRDVVYAATDTNSVYALDATTGKPLWTRRTLAAPLSDAQFLGFWNGDRTHGILSTPVIDPQTGTLYTCTVQARGLRQFYKVWALDVRTGEDRPGWPVTLQGQYKGAKFLPGQVMQRGALTLVDGWLYVPFGGRWDTPPWRGWVMGIDTRRPDSPQRAFCSSTVADGAGIWSGGGVSADAAGALYAATGNGDFDGNQGGDNLSESVVRLRSTGNSFFSRKPADFYTPANFKFLDDQDEDLGGATPNVLPDQPATRTPHLLFIGGKDGVAYLLNRDNLGGIGGEVQKMRLFSKPDAVYHEGIRSTSAYFDAGAKGRFVFVAGDEPGPQGHGMVALQLSAPGPDGPVRMTPVWTLKRDFNGPSSPVVSSNGATGAIVWVVETNDGNQSALLAYDALTGTELYNSNNAKPADHFEGGKRFTAPVVADGRVLIGANGLICFGLAPASEDGKETNR